MTRFSRPSYGYGGGYMARSLSRSGTGLFDVHELNTVYTRHSGIRDVGTKRWLEGNLTSYSPSQFQRSEYRSPIDRSFTPQRSYIR
ncbi:hypothetical protein NECAME_08761 [Necator americanus]|uniref:Uncharacterized protein n=1 Tax=Necator americanus TaxID=51031 RepID=W2THH9_NECAM|nr:hypothetical protein NECAME_08761 [Necator americanus]ETN81059.1 hypothetical protein NECAME_08761 [Necator americanus]